MEFTEVTRRVKDSLKQWGVSANVVVRGKDTLEIRVIQQDLMSSLFSNTPKTTATRRMSVKTHASTKFDRDPPRAEKPKAERRKGFNLHLRSHKDALSSDDLNTLLGLTKGYSFLSVTRPDSKVWEATCREVVWLSTGLFVDSHKWDKKWLTKTEAKGGGPGILRDRFKDVPSAIAAVKECLDYVEAAHNNGGYWYPPIENGKIPRRSLASFLCTQTKSGTEWSPFCEVLWEMHKDTAIKTSIPKLALSVAEQILKDSQYLSSLPSSMLATYWGGVKKYVEWYYANRDILMSVVNNRVRLADVGMAVTLVKEWNASTSGRALPASFIFPGSDKWFHFTQWCRSNRNVTIPDYRQG